MSFWQLNECSNVNAVSVCPTCGKILYSRKEAGYLVNEMHGRHGMRRHSGKVPVRLYPCPQGNGFYHVTSNKVNPRHQIAKRKKIEMLCKVA